MLLADPSSPSSSASARVGTKTQPAGVPFEALETVEASGGLRLNPTAPATTCPSEMNVRSLATQYPAYARDTPSCSRRAASAVTEGFGFDENVVSRPGCPMAP